MGMPPVLYPITLMITANIDQATNAAIAISKGVTFIAFPRR